MRHPEAPVFVNYRMGDVAYAAEGWQYFPESPMAMRHLAGLSAYEQQLLQQKNFEFAGPRTVPLHHTPRVQSGRGALRLASASKVGLGKLERPVVRRSSFPVSNRGKGSRGSPACRISVPSSEISQANLLVDATSDKQAKAEESVVRGLQKISEEVAERVAVAISKKMKRKLPLSSSSSTASSARTERAEEEEDAAAKEETEVAVTEEKASVKEDTMSVKEDESAVKEDKVAV